MYGVRMPTMNPSALHSGMSKKGKCRHNAKVPMWQRLRPDVIHCAAYYAFCGKISPQKHSSGRDRVTQLLYTTTAWKAQEHLRYSQ